MNSLRGGWKLEVGDCLAAASCPRSTKDQLDLPPNQQARIHAHGCGGLCWASIQVPFEDSLTSNSVWRNWRSSFFDSSHGLKLQTDLGPISHPFSSQKTIVGTLEIDYNNL